MKNSVSLVSDEWKTLKTAFRLWFFFENCQKQHFACKRRTENAENYSLSGDEILKMQKITRRRPTKHEKRQKLSIVGRRNAENAKKSLVVGRRSTKNAKNYSLSVDEMLKTPKTVRHPRMKKKKRQKTFVGHGRKRENDENRFSAMADE